MNESCDNINIDAVDVAGVAGGRATAVRVGVGFRVAAAGAPSAENAAGAEQGIDGEGYQVVTRARGKNGANKKADTTQGNPTVFRFDRPTETSKKRRAEELLETAGRETSATAQIEGLKNLILQLLDQNEERTKEAERQTNEIRALRKEVEQLRGLVGKSSVSKPSYAAVITKGIPGSATESSGGFRGTGAQSPRVRVDEDVCAITINTSRFKGEKADFVQVKAALQAGVDAISTLQSIRVRCLRQLPGERINIVFATEAEAKKAKEHPGWLAAVMPQASVKSDAWFPVKCDMVVKRAVLDSDVQGERTLRKEVCAEFAMDNRQGDIDFTAMKAVWISKTNSFKKTGSLVIWLKSRLAANHLLKAGQALFGGGAYGAFCSAYEPSTADKLCFNCNAYGHLQGTCRRAARCGKCSGAHQSRDCTSADPPKCAVCAGSHRSSDWQCKRHPYHKRYLATQVTLAGQAEKLAAARPSDANQDVEMGHQALSQ